MLPPWMDSPWRRKRKKDVWKEVLADFLPTREHWSEEYWKRIRLYLNKQSQTHPGRALTYGLGAGYFSSPGRARDLPCKKGGKGRGEGYKRGRKGGKVAVGAGEKSGVALVIVQDTLPVLAWNLQKKRQWVKFLGLRWILTCFTIGFMMMMCQGLSDTLGLVKVGTCQRKRGKVM